MSKSDPKWLPRDAQNVPNGDQSGPKTESNWRRVLPNGNGEHTFRFFLKLLVHLGSHLAPPKIIPKKQAEIKDEQISKIIAKGPRNDAKMHPKLDIKHHVKSELAISVFFKGYHVIIEFSMVQGLQFSMEIP